MAGTTPSEIVSAIEIMFGPAANDLAETSPNQSKQVEVRALLTLLDDLSSNLVSLSFHDRLEYVRCRAALATVLPIWGYGEVRTVNVLGKNPVERIRRLLAKCPDKPPTSISELDFVTDEDMRLGLEDRLHAAWTDFDAEEWFGATVFGANVLEAILLWALKLAQPAEHGKLDEAFLKDLISKARSRNLIGSEASALAFSAQEARRITHPGRASRSGVSVSKATALTALAAAQTVIEELGRNIASNESPRKSP